ncbi:MAG TPA: hypothetical protein VFO01_12875 [Trebonia sp.]|nr:hypothetical protein [Trebonia sp.]
MTASATRSAATRIVPVPHLGNLLHRSRGHRATAKRDNCAGLAQCPRQVQFLTRSATPKKTLVSCDRGGRPAMRARILSSPSGLGSIPLAASDRARRSASSRSSSSGEVMPRHHPLAASVITFLAPGPA